MGIFINNREHPEVFKNEGNLKETNQVYSRQDFITELVKEQQESNLVLTKMMEELQALHQHQKTTQTNHWNEIGSQISELKFTNQQHEELENQLLQWIKSLDEKTVNMHISLESVFLQRKGMLEQINILSNTNQDIVNRLEQHDLSYQKLSTQIDEQLELQKAASGQQEDYQRDVLKRLDQQEALTEKLVRQLNHIRSILFERTNYLAAKVEDGYKITSSYVYKLMTGSEQPLTFFLLNQKKEENQQQSD